MTEYTPWGELTDASKGYIILFRNRGGTVQRWWCGTQSWEDTQHPDFLEDHYYRVKPEHAGKRMFASIMGLSTTSAWTAYEAELEKSKGDKLMTKLEELKAAYDAAFFAYDAAFFACDAACDACDTAYDAYAARVAALADANDASDAAYAARDDAWSAYQAELKKEQTND